MQQGPAQYPAAPTPPPVPPPVRRGGTGRTVGITVAATLAAYVAVAGAAGTVFALTGSGTAAPEPVFDELPGDPCAAATGSELGALSAALPGQGYYDGGMRCNWVAEFSDGTVGRLTVSFQLPHDDDYEAVVDEEEAEREYDEEAEDLLGEAEYQWRDVIESDELDGLGDEALVSHYVVGSGEEPRSQADVLVRVGTVLIEVSAGEAYGSATGEADFVDDEELLIAVAERAVTMLEERE
ncbi:hypothetical protein KIK06_21595 [Nocardiopsis sp. EMB25]|uniref:hypothetical protein n=1 Tax=Nocardiopsis sp. EMB25 TaxID=2835867 RepID=UPI0022832FE8|nr:hypothetical protein [Nocardiopsis sp. EMB25]MCY9786489.1 hypothetical protein [Nocardiopsis sp. EMB25]